MSFSSRYPWIDCQGSRHENIKSYVASSMTDRIQSYLTGNLINDPALANPLKKSPSPRPPSDMKSGPGIASFLTISPGDCRFEGLLCAIEYDTMDPWKDAFRFGCS